MKLGQSTLDDDERRKEATRVIDLIDEELNGDRSDLPPKDAGIIDKLEDPTEAVSANQLFWLRDIYQRVLGI